MKVFANRQKLKALVYWLIFTLFLGCLLVVSALFTYQKEYEKTQLRLDESAQTYVSLTSFYLDDMDRMAIELLVELENFEASERKSEIEELIRHRKNSNPQIMDILFISRGGEILVWSGDIEQPIANHQSYFETHRELGHSGRLVTPPELLIDEETWFFSLSRSAYNDAGELQGIVVVILQIDMLAELFSSIDDHPFMAVAVVNQNGSLLFRYPTVEQSTGFFIRMPQEISLPLRDKVQQRNISPLDGKTRLFTAKPLEDYPLFVITSADLEKVMSIWRVTQWWLVVLWLTLSLVSLLLILLVFKYRDTQQYQLHLVESSLKESEERFKLIVENANDIIFTLDLEGNLTYVSPNWKNLLGHDVNEVIGCSIAKFVHPDDLSYCLGFLQQVITTGQRQTGIEYRVQDKQGQWHWHMSNGGPLFNSDGVVTEFIGIARDITEKKQLEKKLQQMAMHDALTGLPNRSFFFEIAANMLEIAYRNNRHFALMFIDLDNFKPVNDQFGHAVGDELLKEVAQRMRRNLRASDISGRIGGDEFVVLLSEVADLHSAELVANKLLVELAKPFYIEGREHLVTASIGISLYPIHGKNVDQLSVNADQAMYHAKHLGRNRVVNYGAYLMGHNTSEQ